MSETPLSALTAMEILESSTRSRFQNAGGREGTEIRLVNSMARLAAESCCCCCSEEAACAQSLCREAATHARTTAAVRRADELCVRARALFAFHSDPYEYSYLVRRYAECRARPCPTATRILVPVRVPDSCQPRTSIASDDYSYEYSTSRIFLWA